MPMMFKQLVYLALAALWGVLYGYALTGLRRLSRVDVVWSQERDSATYPKWFKSGYRSGQLDSALEELLCRLSHSERTFCLRSENAVSGVKMSLILYFDK
jgi:hypothetical protein